MVYIIAAKAIKSPEVARVLLSFTYFAACNFKDIENAAGLSTSVMASDYPQLYPGKNRLGRAAEVAMAIVVEMVQAGFKGADLFATCRHLFLQEGDNASGADACLLAKAS